MIKIGDLIYLQSHALLVPKSEKASITLDIEDSEKPLNIIICFEETKSAEEEKPKTGLSIEGDQDHAYVTFHNWNKPFGSSLQKPIAFASSEDGDEILLLASAKESGDVYELTIQFLKKEASNELASE
ncbi:hypothetical protein NCCP2140_28100 [Pseudoalteromonas sp. NCCP-2140]|uniref:DUF6864 domain-containing function n=1 Tax=Pseudoalteromonas sp. NCCP-2140 TaxID=2942288 RepID=UPI0020401F01|nr:hypothetical protein [Pseudoalteromonas sp. NCCP-2140]GKW53757.1 hypothetical protein NCCP2140_28100 [Pseudoalteromonas sp. NCCP-2140]